MDINDIPIRECDLREAVEELAADLVGYADEQIITSDYSEKIDLMLEVFSESILGLFKTYFIINPQINGTTTIEEFHKELKSKLEGYLKDRPNLVN
jgi:hypothetical protein